MRCAHLARELAEPIVATAGSATAWLALEEPGPWGARAPGDSRLASGFAAELARRAADAGLRLQLIKPAVSAGFAGSSGPAGSADAGGRRCLLAYHGDGAPPFLETVELEQPEQVLELDLAGVGRGVPTGAGQMVEERHFLVCTNGKRDPCCAAEGRPVARALETVIGERAWQTTHLGGHRFAANVLVLPDGLLFGQLTPDTAIGLVRDVEAGRLPIAHLRGRSGWPPAVQAAEVFLRRRLTLRSLAAPERLAVDPPTFAHAGGVYRLSVCSQPLPERAISCNGDKLEQPLEWMLTDVVESSCAEALHA